MLEIVTAFLVSGCVLFTDLATEREGHLTTGKRAERTKLDFRCPMCRSAALPLCHWSSQLFDLRAQSSTDVPVLLLNQPLNWFHKTESDQ